MPHLVVRFINEPGIEARLIDLSERGYLCHTEGLSRDKTKWTGAHAGTGVQARPLNWAKTTLELIYAIEVTEQQYEAAMAYMESKIGCPYDYKDILGMALFDPGLNNSHAVICSAFMFSWFWAGGQPMLNVRPEFSYKVNPDTLHLSTRLMGRLVTLEQALAL